MTRKRFVKLLMANGADRNEANRRAGRIPAEVSYASALPRIVWVLRMRCVGTSMKKASKAVGAMADAFSSFTAGVAGPSISTLTADEFAPFGRTGQDAAQEITRRQRNCLS